MFAELCLSMRMLKQAKAKAPPPQCHHFNLSTLVLPDLEQMFKNSTPSNYTNIEGVGEILFQIYLY